MDTNFISQYKDLYIQTSKEYLQSLNNSLLKLEKDPTNKESIAEIFRSAHSLKSQSAAMEYNQTAFLCHVIEDIFYQIQKDQLSLNAKLADLLFQAMDKLTESISSIEKNGSEIDLDASATKLKEVTGVTTTGVGKSNREENTTAIKTKDASVTDSKIENGQTTTQSIDNITPTPTIKTINVKVEQLDNLMNLVEELIEKRGMLKKYIERLGLSELKTYFDTTQRIINDLQYQIMKVRTIPLYLIFDHFPRAVRDLARSSGKIIELQIKGAELELDRSIVDRLDEPIIHLIRNAVSHGIETKGIITLTAQRESDHLIVEVSDNGQGIDWEGIAQKANVATRDELFLKKILFSGISTSKQVTQISGRGVGLQVVKKMVDSVGGRIDVKSQRGKGTTFRLELPLTLAVTKAMLVRIGQQKYAIPTSFIERSVKIKKQEIKKSNLEELFSYNNYPVSLRRMSQIFKIAYASDKQDATELQVEPQFQSLLRNWSSSTIKNFHNEEAETVVLLSLGSHKLGIVVDEILELLDVIVKPIPEAIKHITFFSGITILGDGKACFIINPQGLM